MFFLYVGTDHLGEFIRLVDEDDTLPTGSVRWRLVAQTEDHREAIRLAERPKRQRRRNESAFALLKRECDGEQIADGHG